MRIGQQPNVKEVAHRVAWAAVKRQYRKQGDDWIAR
jgi:cation transport regulator ChaB